MSQAISHGQVCHTKLSRHLLDLSVWHRYRCNRSHYFWWGNPWCKISLWWTSCPVVTPACQMVSACAQVWNTANQLAIHEIACSSCLLRKRNEAYMKLHEEVTQGIVGEQFMKQNKMKVVDGTGMKATQMSSNTYPLVTRVFISCAWNHAQGTYTGLVCMVQYIPQCTTQFLSCLPQESPGVA